jgi:hypothetical protein
MKGQDEPQGALEAEIEALERREAQATLRGDTETLRSLWSDDLLVNSTANLIAGKQVLLDYIRASGLRLRRLDRRIERSAMLDDLVVTTGNEMSQLATAGVDDVFLSCSYMNVWSKRAGSWQLIARHLGLIGRLRSPHP